jgi:hypothetical protein
MEKLRPAGSNLGAHCAPLQRQRTHRRIPQQLPSAAVTTGLTIASQELGIGEGTYCKELVSWDLVAGRKVYWIRKAGFRDPAIT